MKTYLLPIFIASLLLLPIAGALPSQEPIHITAQTPENLSQEFTHTVMVEYATLTTCPPCVIASGQLFSIYESGDLDFYYVSLVSDEGNQNVRKRLNELGVTSVPDVYFDGGYRRLLGQQGDEQPYRNAITQSGERDVPDIDVNVEVKWMGGGILKITGTVVNNEAEEFNGHLRVYITEKESRWNDNGGNPYHFGVLDIPVDSGLAVAAESYVRPIGDTYTFKKLWLGFLHGFSDITQENILVIASVFDQDTDYAVETAASEPTTAQGLQMIETVSYFLQHMREHGFLSRLLNFL
jgi:hypothetical protein